MEIKILVEYRMWDPIKKVDFQKTRNETTHDAIRDKTENEKDIERKWSENKLKEQLEKMQEENKNLHYQLVFNKIEIAKKNLLVENLQQEVRDTSSILTFLENQCQSMKQILL